MELVSKRVQLIQMNSKATNGFADRKDGCEEQQVASGKLLATFNTFSDSLSTRLWSSFDSAIFRRDTDIQATPNLKAVRNSLPLQKVHHSLPSQKLE